MKIILAALAAALSFGASAGVYDVDGQDIKMKVLPSTARVYINSNGNLQFDALVDVSTQGGPSRSRFAVTGCYSGGGQLGAINHEGAITGTTWEWSGDGSKVIDGLAVAICIAGLERARAERAGEHDKPPAATKPGKPT